MTKSILATSVALALALGATVLLSGCSSGGSLSGSSSKSEATWNSPTKDLTGVTITYGGGVAGGPIDQVIKAFEKKTHARIKRVAYPDPYEQNLLTKVATGDKPDLASWQPTTSELTALQAPTNLLSLNGAPWLPKVNKDVRDLTGFVGGTRYAALVTSPSVIGMYYNKAQFAKYGIKTTPKDWAGMVADAKKVKDGGGTPFYEAGATQWPTQWWPQAQIAEKAPAFWKDVNSNKQQFTSPTMMNAITEYKKLIDQGYFNSDIKTGTFENQATSLLNGKVAMVLQVNSYLGQLQTTASAKQIDDKLGWFPISAKGNIGTNIPDNSNAVVAFKTGDAKREAASRQFLNFWMTTDYKSFIKAAGTPSIETGVPSPDGVPEIANEISKSLGSSVGSMQSLAIANPDLYINLANMIQGTMSPEQVAATTQKQFAQLAQAEGAKGF
ncbi:ABC transporter substrate-binding protein [Curtobacterium sp. ISL-83]|uniref:ABC transporter substrate-binding protein n=1 Tax=Curtobacterium sp. ISL-83 TaxID=2819145 RepID=UPI001BE543C9|nr:ABC transporter substrate-binding protein [Curtobacterium sp. ISL-83]MBT2501688.1 carbohydrate ABC transporter substrate-binding protein [Curtobacterium sp. ISL-83]